MRRIVRVKWLEADPPPAWVPVGEYISDAIGDLATSDGGQLSLFSVGDHFTEARIAAAYGANKVRAEAYDYFLIDDSMLRADGFRIEHCPGTTLDEELNRNSHVNVVDLTESRLIRLTDLFRSRSEYRTFAVPTLYQHIRNSIAQGYLDEQRVQQAVKDRLMKLP